MNISVYGMGKLGLPLALLLSEENSVIGMDTDEAHVWEINHREFHSPEPYVDEMLRARTLEEFWVTTDPAIAAARAEVSFILVPTPSKPDHSFDPVKVLTAVAGIAHAVKEKGPDSFHLVVVVSTISPGTIRKQVQPLFEQIVGRTTGWEIVYSPEFVALGQVVRGMRDPGTILIGVGDTSYSEGGRILRNIYRSFTHSVGWYMMSWEEGELAKLMLNTALTVKISLANTVGNLCEEMGLDCDKVLGFLGKDDRIGPKFLKAGLPSGGPCLPRDVRAALQLLGTRGVEDHLIEAIDKMQSYQLSHIIDGVKRLEPENVGILGVSYKADFPDTTESFGLNLLISDDWGARDIFWADIDAVHVPGGDSGRLSVWELINTCDVVIVTLPRPEFAEAIYTGPPGKRYLDCWRFLDVAKVPRGTWLYQLGNARGL